MREGEADLPLNREPSVGLDKTLGIMTRAEGRRLTDLATQRTLDI